jgi:arsenite-transporting ATPase
VVLVARPEKGSLQEASRAAKELQQEKIAGLQLVINGRYQAGDTSDPLALSWAARADQTLDTLPENLTSLPLSIRPFRPGGLLGAASLREFLSDSPLPEAPPHLPPTPDCLELTNLIDQLEAEGPGVILTMGKGGVGKTTVAAAIARGLALRGHPVHLSTTDPAAHIAETLGSALPNLEVDRIDPKAETRKHCEEVMAKAGADLDAQGKELLEEELRSPCTEEVAVFQAFARTVAKGEDRFVVLDTAPTGHTLLLLDASEAYHREVLRDQGELPVAVTRLLPKLRDPAYTRVLLVTLPEATPVHEAQRLQEDLRRAEIEPRAWILNQSLAAAHPQENRLRIQAQREVQFMQEASALARGLVVIPWQVNEPVGAEGLDPLLASQVSLTTTS